jgi:hypothetical protein
MCLFPFELMQFRFQHQVLAGGRSLSMNASAGRMCRMMLLPRDGITPDAIISILHGRRISPILLILRLFVQWVMNVAPKLLEKRHESCDLGGISCYVRSIAKHSDLMNLACPGCHEP